MTRINSQIVFNTFSWWLTCEQIKTVTAACAIVMRERTRLPFLTLVVSARKWKIVKRQLPFDIAIWESLTRPTHSRNEISWKKKIVNRPTVWMYCLPSKPVCGTHVRLTFVLFLFIFGPFFSPFIIMKTCHMSHRTHTDALFFALTDFVEWETNSGSNSNGTKMSRKAHNQLCR